MSYSSSHLMSRSLILLTFSVEICVLLMLICSIFYPKIFYTSFDKLFEKKPTYTAEEIEASRRGLEECLRNPYCIVEPPYYPERRTQNILFLTILFFIVGMTTALILDHVNPQTFTGVFKKTSLVFLICMTILFMFFLYSTIRSWINSYYRDCKLSPIDPQIENGKLIEQCPPKIDWFIEEYIKRSDKYGYNYRYSY